MPINRIGKLIMPTRETDKDQLELLLSRADINNVVVGINPSVADLAMKSITPWQDRKLNYIYMFNK